MSSCFLKSCLSYLICFPKQQQQLKKKKRKVLRKSCLIFSFFLLGFKNSIDIICLGFFVLFVWSFCLLFGGVVFVLVFFGGSSVLVLVYFNLELKLIQMFHFCGMCTLKFEVAEVYTCAKSWSEFNCQLIQLFWIKH